MPCQAPSNMAASVCRRLIRRWFGHETSDRNGPCVKSAVLICIKTSGDISRICKRMPWEWMQGGSNMADMQRAIIGVTAIYDHLVLLGGVWSIRLKAGPVGFTCLENGGEFNRSASHFVILLWRVVNMCENFMPKFQLNVSQQIFYFLSMVGLRV